VILGFVIAASCCSSEVHGVGRRARRSLEREADERRAPAGRGRRGGGGRVAQAESAARTRWRPALAAAEPGIRGAEARTLNAARARLAGRRAARLVARTESAFELAETRLSALVRRHRRRTAGTPRSGDSSPRRRRSSAPGASCASGPRTRGRPELADRLERVGTRLVADPGMAAGVSGARDGHLVVDATLGPVAGTPRGALMAQVAARLRGDGSR